MRISARKACVKPHFKHGVMKINFLVYGKEFWSAADAFVVVAQRTTVSAALISIGVL